MAVISWKWLSLALLLLLGTLASCSNVVDAKKKKKSAGKKQQAKKAVPPPHRKIGDGEGFDPNGNPYNPYQNCPGLNMQNLTFLGASMCKECTPPCGNCTNNDLTYCSDCRYPKHVPQQPQVFLHLLLHHDLLGHLRVPEPQRLRRRHLLRMRPQGLLHLQHHQHHQDLQRVLSWL